MQVSSRALTHARAGAVAERCGIGRGRRVLDAARAVASREPAASGRSRGRATRNLLPRAGGVGQAGGVGRRAGCCPARARGVSPRELLLARAGGVEQAAVLVAVLVERVASGRPRCWSPRGLLLRVSRRCQPDREVGQRATCCLARAASGKPGVSVRAGSISPRELLPHERARRRAAEVLVSGRRRTGRGVGGVGAACRRRPLGVGQARCWSPRGLLLRVSRRRRADRGVGQRATCCPARARGVSPRELLPPRERAASSRPRCWSPCWSSGWRRAGRGVGRRAGRAGGVGQAAVLVAVLVERVASGRPRCWSPRGLLLRVSRRRRRIEASGNAQPVAPRGRRRAGGGCWTPHGLVLRVSGRRRAAEVLLAARAVVPRRAGGVEQAAVSVIGPSSVRHRSVIMDASVRHVVRHRSVIGPSSVRHRSVSSRERAASGRPRCWSPCWASGRRQAGRGVGRRCCPRASGQSGRPRCWSPRELLPRVSGRHRAGRGVGRRASCCLAHVRDTCFQPAASSFRPAARSFRLASSLLHRPIARGDSPRDRLHSRQRAARPVPLSI